MIHVIPIGTSEPQDFQLKNNGTALNGSDFDVELEIFAKTTTEPAAVEGPPLAEWLDQDAGTVRVTGCEALALGIYFVRFKLTDSDDNIGFFPNGDKADVWRVVEIPAR